MTNLRGEGTRPLGSGHYDPFSHIRTIDELLIQARRGEHITSLEVQGMDLAVRPLPNVDPVEAPEVSSHIFRLSDTMILIYHPDRRMVNFKLLTNNKQVAAVMKDPRDTQASDPHPVYREVVAGYDPHEPYFGDVKEGNDMAKASRRVIRTVVREDDTMFFVEADVALDNSQLTKVRQVPIRSLDYPFWLAGKELENGIFEEENNATVARPRRHVMDIPARVQILDKQLPFIPSFSYATIPTTRRSQLNPGSGQWRVILNPLNNCQIDSVYYGFSAEKDYRKVAHWIPLDGPYFEWEPAMLPSNPVRLPQQMRDISKYSNELSLIGESALHTAAMGAFMINGINSQSGEKFHYTLGFQALALHNNDSEGPSFLYANVTNFR